MRMLATVFALAFTSIAWAATADQAFYDKLAQAGLAEVQEGQLAARKTANPRVRQFAMQMIEDHSKANDKLRDLARSKGIQLPTAPSDEQMDSLKKLQAQDGARFNASYVEGQVKDHQEAVELLQDEISSGGDAGAKQLARDLLPTIQAHLQKAQSLAGEGTAAAASGGASQ